MWLNINIKNKQALVDIGMRIDWLAHRPGYKQFFGDIHLVINSKENFMVMALNKLREQTLNAFQCVGCNWRILTCDSTLTSKNEQALTLS